MKKRLLALAIVFVLLLGVLSGCSGNNAASGTPSVSGGDTSTAADPVASEELVNIVWQWPTLGNPGSGFDAVEAALNEMMERDIGVHLTLEPVSAMDLLNQTIMAVSSGTQLDICMQLFTGVAPLVNNGLIIPLNEYMDEYGAAAKEACGDALYSASFQDQLYGIPPAYINGESYGYMARQDMLDKYNIVIDPDKLYTMEEVGKIFEIIKAGEGSDFFMFIPSTQMDSSGMSQSYMEYDLLGATAASGALMLNRSFSDLTIYNLFETQEYADYAALMYEFAQKGFISADAPTNTETADTLISGGHYLGSFNFTTPANQPVFNNACGMPMSPINMIPIYTLSGSAGVSWSVTVNSKNPAKAVQTINYIYENPDAATILQFGLEGQDYEVVEDGEAGKQIRYIAEDPSTLPYYMPLGIYGDRQKWPALYPQPIDMPARTAAWAAAMPDSRKAPAVGYAFDASDVSAELAAVTAVISQYSTGIACGTLPPDSVLPEFIQALKDAGIDTVIAENQRQLDAWAESRGS